MTGEQFKTILSHIKETKGIKYSKIVGILDIPQSTYYYYRDAGQTEIPLEITNKLLKVFDLSEQDVRQIIEERKNLSEDYDINQFRALLEQSERENKRLRDLLEEEKTANQRLIKTVSQLSNMVERLESKIDEITKDLN